MSPRQLWVWIFLTGVAAVVAVVGWRGARWWRRGISMLAVPLCLLCSALMLNLWVGYFPTVQTAWNQLTAGPLPDQTDRCHGRANGRAARRPAKGQCGQGFDPGGCVAVHTHRGELVYLPPAYFATNPPPTLPTVMMIGGEFNTPADWLRAGDAVTTIDKFAAAHGGNAPVFVFVDAGARSTTTPNASTVPGKFRRPPDDQDVVPYLIANFGVSPERSNWGVAGWSMGGTCAVDLAIMHPDMFSAFEDIIGDFAPNSGTKTQTIQRLFGGDAAAYAAFDPATVIARHGPYQGISGWFAISATRRRRSIEHR